MWLPKLVGHRRLPILGWIGHDPFVCWRPEHPGLLHAVTVASFGCTPRLDPIEPRFGDDMLRRASPYLNRLKHLESVVIIDYEIDDGASVLAGLRRLRSLCISGGELGNAGIVHLGRLTRLRALAIAGTGITNGALAALGNCRSLEILDLSDTQVTDAGLVHLGSLANLRELNLALTNVTDTGLVHLASLTNLEELNLAFTKVTDAALVHLKQLEGLRDLDLTHTPVTKEGMDKLKSAIPACRVHRSDSP
jgi:Leucine-rich repeat (LRR) protein